MNQNEAAHRRDLEGHRLAAAIVMVAGLKA
jgi:hypothetical protein